MHYSDDAAGLPTIGEVGGINAGITLGSTNFLQQGAIWTLDSANGLIYQISSAKNTKNSGAIAGVFLSQPQSASTYPHTSTSNVYFDTQTYNATVCVGNCPESESTL